MSAPRATRQRVFGALFGLAVGDALGVPVEYRSREFLRAEPVRNMIGFGTHNQPEGTWSDDSSLAFCVAESVCSGYDPLDAAKRMFAFAREGRWTPYGKVFEIGATTAEALSHLSLADTAVDELGLDDERNNGSGALSRTLPLVFVMGALDFFGRVEHIRRMTALTHRHRRSVLAGVLYVETAIGLLTGMSPRDAYLQMCATVDRELHDDKELVHFSRILGGGLPDLKEEEIRTGGYVVHSVEAALWSLLTTQDFREAVLKAVNLGGDSSTSGAVTGSLGGIAYGFKAIPREWVEILPRKMEIGELADRLNRVHVPSVERRV